ncbi:MAG: Ig-like domain-containing protein [Gammaproteobacteria bacterium]
MNSRHSLVIANDITLNSGGILLTDESGPTSHNVIMNNAVVDNLDDCGITLASHSVSAVDSNGQLQPTQGGIYLNSILNNFVAGNGLDGEGAGVLLAAAASGGAAYDNTIANNRIIGNELSGVTLHSHAPNQYLNGNVIAGNDIGENNLGGDSAAGDTEPTGVLLFSAVVPVINTMVAANHIADNIYGIWLNANTLTTGIMGNEFVNVATEVKTPNVPPTASDGTLTTNENMAASGTLAATDPDGNPFTFRVVDQPSHGSLTIDDASSGAYTYMPDQGYSGDDSFTFKANDGQADSNIATISVTIKAVTPPPPAGGSGGGGTGPFTLGLLALAGLAASLRGRRRAH